MLSKPGAVPMSERKFDIFAFVTALGGNATAAVTSIENSNPWAFISVGGITAGGFALISVWSRLRAAEVEHQRELIKLEKDKEDAHKESLTGKLEAALEKIANKDSILMLRADIIAEQKDRMKQMEDKMNEMENKLNGKLSAIQEDRKQEADRRHDRNNEQNAILMNLRADAEEAKEAAAKAKAEAEAAKEEARIAKAKAEALQKTVAKNVAATNQNAVNVQELAKTVEIDLPDTHVPSDTDVDVKTFNGLD